MVTVHALQYLLLFLFLINVECGDWPDDFEWKCPVEEQVNDCFCKFDRDRKDERFLSCGHSYTVKDYVSRLKKIQYPNNTKLNIRFLRLKKTPNELYSDMFQGLNIKTLIFERSNITKWAEQDQGPAFVGLEDTLESLKIDEYMIRPLDTDAEVAAFTIRHLRKLRELDFRRNSLTHFKSDWLGDGMGDSLIRVSLYNNWIWTVSDDAFASLKKLEHIDLSWNKLSELQRSSFPNPANYLKEMYLNHNNIRSLSEDFFENMPALIDINLNSNQIITMSESIWRPVWSQLRDLNIQVTNLYCYDIEWMFKIKRPLWATGECTHPKELSGQYLDSLIDEKQKET